jgi:uncharacterized spore protein YtfJ
MEAQIQQLLDALADLRKRANVDAVFGKPVAAEGRTVIPVAEVTYAFEVEIDEEVEADSTEGGGGGSGGLDVRPVAVVEVTPENAWVRPIVDEQKLAFAGALLVGWAVFWVARTLVRIFGQRE